MTRAVLCPAPALPRVLRSLLLLLVPILAVSGALAQNESWSTDFRPQNFDAWRSLGVATYRLSETTTTGGVFYDAALYGGDLVAVGRVSYVSTSMGIVDMNGAGRFDGTTWHPLGDGLRGLTGEVLALAVWEDDLFVAGNFDSAGTVASSRIARWDGSVWHAVPGPAAGAIHDLVVFEGDLIAGGTFTEVGGVPALGVARWNGSTWAALGGGIDDSGVTDLTLHDGELVAGGSFETATGAVADYLAVWDGSSWSGIPDGPDGAVSALLSWNGDLLVGGDFTGVGGVPNSASRVAVYDGSTWSTLGSGLDDSVYGFASDAGRLVAVGRFGVTGPNDLSGVGEWTGSAWEPIGFGDIPDRHAFFVDGTLYVTGTSEVEYWDWPTLEDPVRLGVDQTVRELTLHDGDLVAGGRISLWGSVILNHVARFTGNGWESVAGGVGTSSSSDILAMESWAGLLVVSSSSLGVQAYDGATWSSMSAGLPGGTVPHDFQEYGGVLYAGLGGTGTSPGDHLWSWTGSAWAAVAGPQVSGFINCLRVYGGELYIGGEFSQAGGIAMNKICAYDGTSFRKLGVGIGYGNVLSFGEYDGKLIVGGQFETAGPLLAKSIAAYDGSSWSQLGDIRTPLFGDPDNPGQVRAIAEYNGRLFVGGLFTEIDQGVVVGIPAKNIAAYDGTDWEGLGSGPSGPVYALLPRDGALWVGGQFTLAGGNPAYNITQWTETITGVGGEWTVLAPPLASPNPFRASTRIRLALEARTHVTAAVYDVQGRRVRSLMDEPHGPGAASVSWDGLDGSGAQSPAGVYFLRVTRDGQTATRRVVRLP